MKPAKTFRRILLAACAASPVTVLACGEMMFNAGKGLPFQSYIAPQPAEVLVLLSDGSYDAYYAELRRAGHNVTLAINAAAMERELAEHSFDIVIADFDALSEVPARVAESNGSGPRLLPIVARNLRKSPQVRERFQDFLVDGASVGTFLAAINRALDSVI